MAPVTTAELHTHVIEVDVEFVVQNDQSIELEREKLEQRSRRLTRKIHVGIRHGENQLGATGRGKPGCYLGSGFV